MNVNVTIILETRTPRKKKKDSDPDIYPVKLRLTQNKTQRYFSVPSSRTNRIPFEATSDDWEKITAKNPRGKYRDFKLQMDDVIRQAEEIIKKMPEFSFERFKELFKGGQLSANESLFGQFDAYISELRNEERVATADSYQCALNSLKKFDPTANFNNIDKNWLIRYENWFLQQTKDKKGARKKSSTTVGIYTRSLRTIFNIARNKGITENYPFGKQEYTPPKGENIKKALTLEDIKKIREFQAEHKSPIDKARDLWVFSYFSNGMNIKDICSIKEKDIKGDFETIEFVREKTKRSSRANNTKIEVVIVPETKEILQKWGKFTGDEESYVFPFFSKNETPEAIRKITIQLTKTINKYMRRIAKEAGINQDITTYFARHSFASILKESGAPVEYISESLGHRSLQTTESYLKSFSRAHKEKWADALRGNKSEK